MKFILIERKRANEDCPPIVEWMQQVGNKLFYSNGG